MACSRLIKRGTRATCDAIADLRDAHPEWEWLSQSRLRAQEIYREKTWEPLTPEKLLDILASTKRLDVRSPTRNTELSPATWPSRPGPIQRRFAILVGVNRYTDRGIPNLNFCVNDVIGLARTLDSLEYTTVTLYDDHPGGDVFCPTRHNIEGALANICSQAGPDDLILCFFALHGSLVDDQLLLLTREVRTSVMALHALPLANVVDLLKKSPAARRVLFLDACHTGADVGRGIGDPDFVRHVHDEAAGFALLAAATSQQVAHEWREEQHGVFTYFLMRGLSGDASRGQNFVTVEDLNRYVVDELKKWSVKQGLRQEP